MIQRSGRRSLRTNSDALGTTEREREPKRQQQLAGGEISADIVLFWPSSSAAAAAAAVCSIAGIAAYSSRAEADRFSAIVGALFLRVWPPPAAP